MDADVLDLELVMKSGRDKNTYEQNKICYRYIHTLLSINKNNALLIILIIELQKKKIFCTLIT